MLHTIMGWTLIVSLLVSECSTPLKGQKWIIMNFLFNFLFLLQVKPLLEKVFISRGCHTMPRGRSGIMVRPKCRLAVVVREITPEEEAKIARPRVSNFKKFDKAGEAACPPSAYRDHTKVGPETGGCGSLSIPSCCLLLVCLWEAVITCFGGTTGSFERLTANLCTKLKFSDKLVVLIIPNFLNHHFFNSE